MTARPLETVLADWRGDAAVLRKHGDGRLAEALERCAQEAHDAAEDYLRWLTEEQAENWSGKGRDWLRRRYPEWETMGHAKRDERGRRLYRAMIVPRRLNAAALEADAQATARAE